MTSIDPILSLAFAMRAAPGAHAVLLGSGVSRAAGIPTGWQVVLDLITQLAAAQQEEVGSDPEAWYTTKFRKAPDYSDLLNNLVRTPDERRGLLHGYFEPNEDERDRKLKRPTDAHRAIARMMARGHVRVILTTNFDQLMETALREEGTVPMVISSTDSIKGAPPLSHWRNTVVKLHGDYLDPRIRNTKAELETYDPPMNALLDRILDEFGLIIAGWSGEWDEALRAALERCPNRRFTALWADPGELKTRARNLATLRGIEVVDSLDADRLFVKLDETLLSLTEIAERRFPLSPAVATATAKRWLAEPDKNRIRLHDMVMEEVDRVCATASPEHFPTESCPPGGEELKRRLERYEALTETLRALAVTFVQWGDERSLSLWTKVVERLNGRETTVGGYDIWAKLQHYPTLLVLYAGGVAAVAQGRYDWLRALLTDYTHRENGEQKPIGAIIMTTDVIDPDHYNKLLNEGRSKRTPMSIHLFNLMRHSLNQFTNSELSYQSSFDRFEYLQALLIYNHDGWGNFGCFAWRSPLHTNRNIISEIGNEIDQQGAKWPPLATGFFGASSLTDIERIKDEFDARIKQTGWRLL